MFLLSFVDSCFCTEGFSSCVLLGGKSRTRPLWFCILRGSCFFYWMMFFFNRVDKPTLSAAPSTVSKAIKFAFRVYVLIKNLISFQICMQVLTCHTAWDPHSQVGFIHPYSPCWCHRLKYVSNLSRAFWFCHSGAHAKIKKVHATKTQMFVRAVVTPFVS